MTAVDNIGLAVAEHEACPDCSRPGRVVWHYEGSRCPFRMRYHAVPCRSASLAESAEGRHFTRNENRVCDACLKLVPAAQERARALLAKDAKRDAVIAQLKGEQS